MSLEADLSSAALIPLSSKSYPIFQDDAVKVLHSICLYPALGASLVAQLVKKIRPQCGRPGFDPWVGKIPWRRERLLSPVLWPREIQELYSPWGCKESDTTERLSLTHSLTQHLGESIPFDQFLCHLACPLTSPFPPVYAGA